MHTWGALFDSLTAVDGSATPQPALATSWRAVDPLTWHFELRRGVSFSNGERFNAAAVVATVAYLRSEAAAGLSVARELQPIAAAEALDEYTVRFRTHQPTLILPALLAGMRIVAPGHWRHLGPEGFAQDPVGTGPFKLESWSPARVELVAYPNSWRAPKGDRLELYEILEPSARLPD